MAWVSTGVALPPPGEEITFYLNLKKGQKADLEVVGRAAAAFAETVKEISYFLDPGLEVRLEFESGTEGSIKLKAILRAVRKPETRRNAIIAVIGTVGSVLIQDVRTYGVGKFLDNYLMPEQRQQLSDSDLKRITDAVTNVKNGKMAQPQIQEMYQQLDRDEAIESVGSIAKPDEKPIDPVPRAEFPVRAGIVKQIETSPKKRTSKMTDRLTLISPVLLQANRLWRFRSALGEHGYLIRDAKFLSDLLSGKGKLPMKEGNQITAEIEIHEALEGGVWVTKERFIDKVVTSHRPPKQSDLFSQPKKRKGAAKKKRKTK